MTRLFVGNKAGVGPVVKIMVNDGDDPLTTPNSDMGRFYFNSENPKVGYIRDVINFQADFATYPTGTGIHFIPSGSNINTCQMSVISGQNSGFPAYQIITLYPSYFGMPFMPLCETRFSNGSTFQGPSVNISTGQVTTRGQVYSRGGYASETGGSGTGSTLTTRIGLSFTLQATGALSQCFVTVFNLPMYADAIPNYAGTPSSGQEVVRLSNDGIARVSLPGYIINDTNLDHFILHENRIPAKMLRSGELTLALGASASIVCPVAVTPTTYMDFHVKRNGEARFWQPPYISSIAAQATSFNYTVSGNTVTVTNTADAAINIRYAIFADSDQAYTTGGSKVMLKANDGTRDYVQVKRPGSSDAAPNLNDIMVDTRMAYFPILAEGFLSYPGDFPTAVGDFRGERSRTITFSNPSGLLPMVKAGIIFDDNPGGDFGQPKAVWGEHAVMVNAGSTWTGRATSRSVWSDINSTSVTFYSGGNNPYTTVSSSSIVAYYAAQNVGLRYYIFGLPNNL